jgi:hypothetical protein
LSIYGETSTQFRTRPSGIVILAFSLFCTLVGATLGPVLFSLARTLATRALRADYVFNVHAPIGANPSLGLFPIHPNEIVTGAVIAVAAVALLTALFAAFYPASQKVANQLAIDAICAPIVATGCAATLADVGLVRALSRWKELPELASAGMVAAVVFALLLIVVWLERRAISLLGNLFAIDTPANRLLLWALRIPLPWAAFAGLCWATRWWGGVIAAAGVIVLTLVDDLVRFPALRYQTLDRPKMHEGLAAALIAALVLAAGSVWAFGLPAAQIPARALVIEKGSASLVPVSELTNRILEDVLPRIDMKWSNEK